MTVIGIQRDERFSPNSVEKDLAILRAVVEPLGGTIIPEAELAGLSGLSDKSELSDKSDKSDKSETSDQSDLLIFSMARTGEALTRLRTLEEHGARVINPARGVEACGRSNLVSVMRELGIPQPPAEGDHGYWLKRGDAAAQSKADVVFCHDRHELDRQQQAFRMRGITDQVVQAHVEGDLVKFYGVRGTGFFRTCYPGDDGQTKFGDELRNGRPHHYAYDRTALQAAAERLSEAIRVPVYGGDAIIRSDGSFVVIDFNDWPSFSRCRDEAAEAIKRLKN